MFTPNPYIALACTLALGTLERGSFHLIHNVQATENTLAYKDICEYDCSEHGTVRKIDIFKLTCKVLSCLAVPYNLWPTLATCCYVIMYLQHALLQLYTRVAPIMRHFVAVLNLAHRHTHSHTCPFPHIRTNTSVETFFHIRQSNKKICHHP